MLELLPAAATPNSRDMAELLKTTVLNSKGTMDLGSAFQMAPEWEDLQVRGCLKGSQ